MPLFGKRIDGVDGRRFSHREPLFLVASVFTFERSYAAAIVDVSAIGARLSGCADLRAGQDLWIKVGVVDALATVVWCEDELCGVAFDAPLSEADMHHLRCEARNTLVMPLSAEERLAAQQWITGLAR